MNPIPVLGQKKPSLHDTDFSGKNDVFDFEPLHHFLHVRPVKVKDLATDGGIILPDNTEATVFEVLAAGPGYIDPNTGAQIKMSAKKGDLVLADPKRLLNLSYGGQNVMVVSETDVFGKVHLRAKTGPVGG